MLALIEKHFADVPEPRVRRCRLHALFDIFAIAFAAVLCGAEGWEQMSDFGRARSPWLKERLGLSLTNGVPSADTFRRVFAALDPDAFEKAFRSWVQTLRKSRSGQVVALDGQVLRRSFDSTLGQGGLHLVRAGATDERLVWGAMKVAEGSNEIPAVQVLLELLDLQGCLVTADAMHCQKETAERIIDRGGDYLLALKDNQTSLCQDVGLCFGRLDGHPASRGEWQEARTVEVLTLALEDPEWRGVQREWKRLRSLVRVKRTRTCKGRASQETAYYLSSQTASARALNRAIRQHWHIENGLHWVLDVGMNADACRVRRDHGPQNLALARSVAINLLRQHPKGKRGIRALQKLAGWDQTYLDELIG